MKDMILFKILKVMVLRAEIGRELFVRKDYNQFHVCLELILILIFTEQKKKEKK